MSARKILSTWARAHGVDKVAIFWGLVTLISLTIGLLCGTIVDGPRGY